MTAIDESYPFDTSAVFEDQWRKMGRLWATTGVVSGLAVSPNAGMVLNVAPGGAWVDGFYAGVTATKTVTLSAAHATLPRIDLVVLRLDPVANTVTLEVLTGTAAVTPAAPALTQLPAGNYELPLAEVYVGATVTSITAAKITDRRVISTTGTGAGGAGNPVQNASAKVWQDGTSIACGAGAYTADGWYGRRATSATGQTVSQQAAGDTQGSQWCFRQARDNGNASTAQMILEQSLLTADSGELAGQLVTISARVRAGASYSGGAASLALITGTGTDQSVRAGLTGQATAGTATVTPSTTWQTITATCTLAAAATQLAVQATWTPTGTAGAADYLEWKDVRIDRGATPQPHTPERYADDLHAAHYRYWRMAFVLNGDSAGRGFHNGTIESRIIVHLPRPMRSAPTASLVSGALSDLRIFSGDGTKTPSALSAAVVHSGNSVVELPFVVTTVTARGECEIGVVSGSPAIGFDARF